MNPDSQRLVAIGVLLDEHERCRAQLLRAEATPAAARLGDPQSLEQALAAAGALLHFLETSLETHIAKEEGPLFPRLKAALPAGDRLIDEMVAEHDLIRMKRDDVQAILEEILGGHDDVRAERETLRAAIAGASRRVRSLAPLVHARESVAAKLRVHFANEEELVFPLAPELLSAEELITVMEEMAQIRETATG
jgi:hemerythrin-like domain-containing protein